jgi:hypothetical protein
MPRPIKTGLDYFPFDVDFFDDEKIEAISGEFGIKGELVTIRLLCAIYRNGYYIEWNDILKMKLLKKLSGIGVELLDLIVARLVAWGFFDKSLFDSAKVLTSKGIQARFQEATKRRNSCEITVYAVGYGVNDNKNPVSNGVNVVNNTQSKVKESKVKGREPAHDLSRSNLYRQPVIPTIEEVQEVFTRNGGTHEMAQRFFENYSAVGWYYKSSPLRSFAFLVPGFIQSWNKNEGSDLSGKKQMVM